MKYDLIIYNANIYGDFNTKYNSIAVKAGRIIHLAKDNSLKDFNADEKIDMMGKTVLPGFIDSHSHFSYYYVILSSFVNCQVKLNEDMIVTLDKMKKVVEKTTPGEWIRGWGFTDYKVKEERYPTLEELDSIASNNPVAIIHNSWHTAVVNTLGLKKLGIPLINKNNSAENPKEIIRDRNGKSTGLLIEKPMFKISMQSMLKDFDKLPYEEKFKYMNRATDYFASMGITTIVDPACPPETINDYCRAYNEKKLKMRHVIMPEYNESSDFFKSGVKSNIGNDILKIGAVKIFSDGSFSARTAAVSIPFKGDPNGGDLFFSQEELDKIVQELDSAGYQIATHAIGDRAIREVINSYKKVIKDKKNPQRHRIEHISCITPDLIKEMAEYNIQGSVFPQSIYEQGDSFNKYYGDNIDRVYPFRSLIDNGVFLTGSSDCPVLCPNPILAMKDALNRTTEQGLVLSPDQRITAEEAFKLYTINSAYSVFAENDIGSLEEGKLADFIVLTDDLFNIDSKKWEKINVEKTFVGGKLVFTK